jgi:hypothetical protein
MANIFPNAGKAHVVKVLAGETALPADYYLAWGTGTGQSVTDTALDNTATITESRTAAVSSSETGSVTDDTFRNTGTITCTSATKTISEAGLFTASAAGDMVVYGDFTGIPLNVGDSITFTVDLRFA